MVLGARMIERLNPEDELGKIDGIIGLSSGVFQSPDDPITRSLNSFEPLDRPITLSLSSLQSPDDPITRSPDSAGRSRRSKRGAPGGRRRLPQFVQALAEQMLAQGSTSEEVARAARECGFSQTTAAKVDRWLRQDAEARERLIRRQVKTAKDLQASIGAGGDATDELRADVALLGEQAESAATGTSAPLDVQNLAAIHRSLRAQLKIENDSLKRRAKRLLARKAYLARRIEHAQMRLDHARLEVVQRRLGDLRNALEGSTLPDQEPGPSVFAEIVSSLCRLLKIGK